MTGGWIGDQRVHAAADGRVAMACGSARMLADVISGRAPEIRADDLSVQRHPRPQRQGWRAPWAEPGLSA